MSRILLFAVSLAVWAGAIFVVLSSQTSERVTEAHDVARQKLKAAGPKVALAAESLERSLLDDAREAALGIGIGASLDRIYAGPAKPKKTRKPQPEVVLAVEQAAELVKDVDDAAKELAGTKRAFNVFDKYGRVVIAQGADAMKVGTNMRNAPEVGAALEGVSQLVAIKGPRLVAFAPTIGKDGAVNGAIALGQPLDASFCAAIAGKSALSSLAIFDGQNPLCGTAGFELASAPAGETIKPSDVAALMFVESGSVGTMITRADATIPVLGATIVLAEDMHPAFEAIASWQQQTVIVFGGLLAVVWLLLGAAFFVGARPADTIANHLALLHQGGKVPALNERKFGGGFRRIVKNLNTLLEKREHKGGPSLQPISSLLAGSPEPAEQEMRFEPADSGTIKPKTQELPKVEKPLTLPPMVQPKPASSPSLPVAEKPPSSSPSLPPLSPATFDLPKKEPPPAALNALFDDKSTMLDEDKTTIAPPPAPPDADSALPPLPAFPQETPRPPAVSVSSGFSDLNTSVPSGLTPPETPWDPPATTTAKKDGISEQDEEHYHQVFEEFLKVRAQCGEPTSNLTFDKFVEKLKKSRDQVMQKQNTKVVRFQVYVKDGKAALKAVAAK